MLTSAAHHGAEVGLCGSCMDARAITDTNPERLAWGHAVHPLRALVEIASWEAASQIDERAGHPWLAMRSSLEAHLTLQ